MELLQHYQTQMWKCIKKYLDLMNIKDKQTGNQDPFLPQEIKEVIKELIHINDRQKLVLKVLRQKSKKETRNREELERKPEEMETEEKSESGQYSLNLFQTDQLMQDIEEESTRDLEGKEAKDCLVETGEDIHDLVTPDEYMHSLGLLTQKESVQVRKMRRERLRKTVNSHIFNPDIWEKGETKRKRKDWLVSGSPPQLRRKGGRPNSEPSSRIASRGTSPLEGGSSSPLSSQSPNSPSSPNLLNSFLPTEETCQLCQQIGANLQCDACGIFYHVTCTDVNESNKTDSFLRWLCMKCQLGLRKPSYVDPYLSRPLTIKASEKKNKSSSRR